MLARLDHEPVIFRGQGRIDAAGVVGGHEQCLAQDRVAAFGGWPVPAGQAGGVEGGHEPGEGAGAGQGGEPSGVAEPSQDRGGGGGGDAGGRGDDPGRVGLFEQERGAFAEFLDFLGELQREPDFDRDVFVPQLECFGGGLKQADGLRLAPGAAGMPVAEAGQPRAAEPFDGVRSA